MSSESPSRRAVKVLRDSVARRIAAGEVIERPASVVRELLDNALDAGCSEVAVHIAGGGIERIRVVDDGAGMTGEDLRLCWLPHATSKIETEEDLYRIRSLGFRGEALSSIAAVSRLSITSRTPDADTATRLVVHGGDLLSLEPAAGRQGTIVETADLFYAIPARRRFMKRPSAETAACGQVFLEKAAAFPGVAFKFFTGEDLKTYLPAADLPGRIAASHPGDLEPRFLHSLKGSGEGFSLEIVAMTPDLSFRDRKYIQTYINRRRIWDFSLVQGVEYSYGDYLPGGRFPACFVFVDIDPSLVDFNIHPAKKEAKIKNLQDVRRRITEVLGSFLRETARRHVPASPSGPAEAALPSSYDFPADGQAESGVSALGTGFPRSPGESRYAPLRSGGSQDLRLHENPAGSATVAGAARRYDFVYRGQVFGLFLIAERGDRLYLVDQHAAHERLLYDACAADTLSQPLLFPVEFETDDESEPVTRRNSEEISALGIKAEPLGGGRWALTALPAAFRGAEGEVIETLASHHGAAGTLKKVLFANMACKKAVKDGSAVDPATACEIIRQTFLLENPRCPHGRPLWFEVSREELFRQVGRIV